MAAVAPFRMTSKGTAFQNLVNCFVWWKPGPCRRDILGHHLTRLSVTHFLWVTFNSARLLPETHCCQERCPLGGTFQKEARSALEHHWTFSHLTSLPAAPSPPQTPHFPPDSDLLLKASRTYHRFLTWPVPYCSICQELLTFIDAELKAPGECGGGQHMGQGPYRSGDFPPFWNWARTLLISHPSASLYPWPASLPWSPSSYGTHAPCLHQNQKTESREHQQELQEEFSGGAEQRFRLRRPHLMACASALVCQGIGLWGCPGQTEKPPQCWQEALVCSLYPRADRGMRVWWTRFWPGKVAGARNE